MNVEDAYNGWSQQYDSNENKTRDLEALSLRESLSGLKFTECLEIGCGTGKNTEWLATISQRVTAVDLSAEMLPIAKQKVLSDNVHFVKADISAPWHFATASYDLITFSLVLEHLDNLESILQKTSAVIGVGGLVYIGELHPFKQYSGTKARFDTPAGRQELPCFTHHISDFTRAGQNCGFSIEKIEEYFDDKDKLQMPRILTLLLRKK